MITLPSSPSPLIALAPSAANAAPTSPPISACDEDDGRPKYHVARFHAIAPMRPAKTTVIVTALLSTMSWPTVAATLSDRNAPTKLKIAANMHRDARWHRARRDRRRRRRSRCRGTRW